MFISSEISVTFFSGSPIHSSQVDVNHEEGVLSAYEEIFMPV
jgi:hypothetical protein